MSINYGSPLNDLADHPDFNIIQHLTKTVIQIRCSSNSKNLCLGTGFFLFQKPPILLTARHVIPDIDIKNRAYIRFHFESPSFIEGQLNTYYFNNKDKLFPSKNLDYSIIELNSELEREITAINHENLGEFPKGVSNNIMYETQISIIHHPTDLHKHIATSQNSYRVYIADLNRLSNFLIREIDKWRPFLNQVKNDEYFVYWAEDDTSNSKFVRCTLLMSSGSPIFNKEWQLIGLHIGGAYRNPTKRIPSLFSVGIPISEIFLDINSNPKMTQLHYLFV